MAQINTWDKQTGESKQAFEGFETYRDMPPGTRSLSRVSETLQKALSQISGWSAKWGWVERADEYDLFVSKRKLEARLRAIDEMEERHVKMAMAGQRKALEALNELNFKKLTPDQIKGYLVEFSKMERTSRGEPETIEERRETLDATVDLDVTDVIEKYGPALANLIQRGALSTNGHSAERVPSE